MLYKQAWQELKDYIKITTTIWDTPEENKMRKRILRCMKQLEKRWKIIPNTQLPPERAKRSAR